MTAIKIGSPASSISRRLNQKGRKNFCFFSPSTCTTKLVQVLRRRPRSLCTCRHPPPSLPQDHTNHFRIRFEQLHPTMATIALINEAILALKDRTGSSVIAINKYIESEKKVRLVLRLNKAFPISLFGVRTGDFSVMLTRSIRAMTGRNFSLRSFHSIPMVPIDPLSTQLSFMRLLRLKSPVQGCYSSFLFGASVVRRFNVDFVGECCEA